MNKQEIFDKVAKHLLTQKAQSSADDAVDGPCLYRGPNGLKCAVGCLIKDEYYSPDLEGLIVCDKEVKNALRLSGVKLDYLDVEFLNKLQVIHDFEKVKDWHKRLKQFAEAEDLNSDCLKGF